MASHAAADLEERHRNALPNESRQSSATTRAQ